jgi:MFS transporter, DHA1 family, inner membrane transport protein
MTEIKRYTSTGTPTHAVDRRVFLLALGTFAVGTDAFVIAGILPGIPRNLSTSIQSAGLVVSVFSVSYALGSPIASALTARWRRQTVLVGGLATFALANVLSAISPTLILLLATRVCGVFGRPRSPGRVRSCIYTWIFRPPRQDVGDSRYASENASSPKA